MLRVEQKLNSYAPAKAFVLSRQDLIACQPGGGVLPYMGYMGMCRCEGYGFQAVYSRIGYINQNIYLGLE